MTLDEYKRKRKAVKTTEPYDSNQTNPGTAQFVVQKHDAKQLHYDLRLEMDGVLKSWAVPKGPSLDPSVKRLAIHVEDHPLSYARFEGVIPDGQYGAGKMIVWDLGSVKFLAGEGIGYEAGNLKFILHGEKLLGKWALVKMKTSHEGHQNQWLLIKERDKYAKSEKELVVTNALPHSVLTGRDVHELVNPERIRPVSDGAIGESKQPNIPPLEPGLLPDAIASDVLPQLTPQLATACENSPQGEGWLHEIKFDGYRLLAAIDDRGPRLLTRNQQDWTKRFPSLEAELGNLNCQTALLDGELVSLRSDGVSDFASLQSALRDGNEGKLVYFSFDLLHLNGFDLSEIPLVDRKSLLERLLSTHSGQRIQYCAHVIGSGPAFYEQCRAMGLEGAISKKIGGRYRSGRSQGWLKRKCFLADDFLVLGYTRSENRKGSLRSLVLGSYQDSRLIYVGKVGTGFDEPTLQELKRRCDELQTADPALEDPPEELRDSHVVWILPDLIVRVQYLGWTSSGQLRHASFLGLRSDISPEQAASGEKLRRASEAIGRTETTRKPVLDHVTNEQLLGLSELTLSNPDKIFFPFIQGSKLDVAKYYVAVSEWLLPYIEKRPISLIRYPDGIEQASFFQKHPSEGMSPSLQTTLAEDTEKPMIVVSNLMALSSAVQLAAIEFHPWSAKQDRLDRPDRLLFDFDPHDGVSWNSVKHAAWECKEILDRCGLASFVKTSGRKGLHVVVPILRRSDWNEVLLFAREVATSMVKQAPQQYTLNLSKQQRAGKILIDIHRNHAGATCVAAYSLRATPTATVSMPLAWQDLEQVSDPKEFDIESATRIVGQRRTDPWEEFYQAKQSLTRHAFGAISKS